MGLLAFGAGPYAGRMTDAPKYERFVRCVPGRLVARYGTGGLIGAERRALSKRERREGRSPIVWHRERITPLSAEYCRKYKRELAGHFRNGDLVEVTEEEWRQQVEREAADSAARAEARKAQEAAGKPAAEGTETKSRAPGTRKAKRSDKESEQ